MSTQEELASDSTRSRTPPKRPRRTFRGQETIPVLIQLGEAGGRITCQFGFADTSVPIRIGCVEGELLDGIRDVVVNLRIERWSNDHQRRTAGNSRRKPDVPDRAEF